MHRPVRIAVVAMAFAAGLPLRAPAYAQSADAAPAPITEPDVDASRTDLPPDGPQSWTASPTPDAQAIGTNAAETPLTTSGADASWPDEAPPSNVAEPFDAPAIGTDATDLPVTTAEPSAAPSQAELPPDEALSADVAATLDAQSNAADASATTLEPGAEASQADLPPVGPPTGTAGRLAEWVIATGDNGGRPFVIVDKSTADAFVFDPDGMLQGAAPVLVGQTQGDDSAPGVGDRELSAISPEERTTPAGRFVAAFGPASGHRRVLWVDYRTAISLHAVVTTNRKEHRLERLRSPFAEDRRITYGCINVPTAFYRDVVLATFAGGAGVVYILPDSKPLEDVFPAFAVATNAHGLNGLARAPGPQQAADLAASTPPLDAPTTSGDDFGFYPSGLSAPVSAVAPDDPPAN